MHTRNQRRTRAFFRKPTSTLDFDKITALNRRISPLNIIGFSLFKHNFKAYGGSKFLHFTLQVSF